MLNNIKSFEELTTLAVEYMQSNNIDLQKGNVSTLVINCINLVIADFYKTMNDNFIKAFLSKSSDECLDYIGALLNCTRGYEELDDDYKIRISKQVTIIASSNEESIKYAVKEVSGVNDVKLVPYTYGNGSFTVFPRTKFPNAPAHILESVANAVDGTCAYGIKNTVENPIVKEVELKVKLIFSKDTIDSNRNVISSEVLSSIKQYINSLNVGDKLETVSVINIIKKYPSVIDYQLYDIKIDNKTVIGFNHNSNWNEVFVESSNPNAIFVS